MQGHLPLGGLSQSWFPQELSILYYLPAVVKLGSDGGPSSIFTLAIQKPADGLQGNVNLHAPDLNLLQMGMFSGRARLMIYDQRVAMKDA